MRANALGTFGASLVVGTVVLLNGPATAASAAHRQHGGDSHRSNTLNAGLSLLPGRQLLAPGGGFSLVMRRAGNLVEVARDGQREWSSGTHSEGGVARVLPGGGFVVDAADGRRLWTARSGGRSVGAYRLVLQHNGALEIRSRRGTVLWTNHLASRCGTRLKSPTIIVSITYQHLWACRRARLVLSTPVTTAAVSRGWITPVGSWRVYAKERDVNLVGPSWNDHVHYWMPYSGPYGLHDATWQKFPEGSDRYKAQGSHGCVHVPLAEMKRLYAWTRVGTRVMIRPS